MSTRQKPTTAPTWRSGWCGTSQHDPCKHVYPTAAPGGATCSCPCHTCPTCGQVVPRA